MLSGSLVEKTRAGWSWVHHSHVIAIKGASCRLREERRAGIVPAPEVAD